MKIDVNISQEEDKIMLMQLKENLKVLQQDKEGTIKKAELEKVISFDKAKCQILDNKLKKEHEKELTKIALTSYNLSEYAVMSMLYKIVEAGNKIINDPEKRARVKKIYRGKN